MRTHRLIVALLILNTTVWTSVFWMSVIRHQAPLQHHDHYQFSSDKEELQFLNKWYSATNDTYFDNKLPKDTKIELREIPADIAADFTVGQTTPLGNGQYIVEIDPRFNPSGGEEALTLDHEICHIYLLQQNNDGDSKHGSRFQSCMQRLAAEGAFQNLW
jgi:SprT-like family